MYKKIITRILLATTLILSGCSKADVSDSPAPFEGRWGNSNFDIITAAGVNYTTTDIFDGYILPIDKNDIDYAAGPVGMLGGVPGMIIGNMASGVLRYLDEGGHADWARDLRIPTYVDRCVHLVAAHEVREKFPLDSVREDQVIRGKLRCK